MARGRKKQENLTLEEQLNNVENQISETEMHLKELKDKRKELNEKIKEEQKERLYKAVLQSGKTIEEIIEQISEKEEESNLN